MGELEVRLCPHEENKNWIKVEVSEEGLLLLDEIDSYNEAIEDCNEGIENYEKIGQNCLLGGLSVIEAIDRGVFARSGGLMHPEVISESNNKWTEREELRRTSDPRREVSR